MNHLPKYRAAILTGLAKAPAVFVTCQRPRKFARELASELPTCNVKIEREDRHAGGGVLRITQSRMKGRAP